MSLTPTKSPIDSVTDTTFSLVDKAGTTYQMTALQMLNYILANANTAELIRDTMGAALIGGSGIGITVNDAADTITLAYTGATGGGYTDENAQDAVAAMIAAGTQTGVTVTYNDAANSLSFNVTGGGGGSGNLLNQVILTGGGKYIPPRNWGFANSGAAPALVANNLYAMQFDAGVSITALSTNVATAGSQGLKMALAKADGVGGMPKTLIEAVATAQSTVATGAVDFALSTTRNMTTLAPNRYWVLIMSDGAPLLTAGATNPAVIGSDYGQPGMAQSSSVTRLYCSGFGYANAIPSDLSTLTWTPEGTGGSPAIVAVKTA